MNWAIQNNIYVSIARFGDTKKLKSTSLKINKINNQMKEKIITGFEKIEGFTYQIFHFGSSVQSLSKSCLSFRVSIHFQKPL